VAHHCPLFPTLIFVDENELKQSFRNVLGSRGKEFDNAVTQHLIQRWQKSVKMTGILWKNRLIIAKDVRIVGVNFVVVVVTFSEKKSVLLSCRPLH
jgi:hypothetical protein